MRGCVFSALAGLLLVPLDAQQGGLLDQAVEAATELADNEVTGVNLDELPPLEQLVPPPMQGWAPAQLPEWSPLEGMDLAVTATDPVAAQHVVAGIQYLHLFWDQQALRHFAEALRRDRSCPLAWWGVAMSLLPQNNEFVAQRNLAMAQLPKVRALAAPWEQCLIDMLLLYPREGVPGAVNQLDRLLELKPGDLNALLLKTNFLRGGHATDGNPEPNLRRAQEIVAELLDQYPQHPLVYHYALRVTWPAPLKRQGLAVLAANLVASTQISPYLCYEVAQVRFAEGKYGEVRRHCATGIALARAWLLASQAAEIDCPLLFELYSLDVAAALELGEVASARTRAQTLAAVPISRERERSGGVALLRFRGILLPARVPMRFGQWQQALELVPVLEGPLDPADLAPWSWRALEYYLNGRVACGEGDTSGAREWHGRLVELGARYLELAPEALSVGQRQSWHGEQRLFEQYNLLLQADIARAEGNTERAYLWLRTALGALQRIDPEAPPLLTPGPREILGEIALAAGDAELARRAFDQALSSTEREQAPCWLGLAQAFQAAGDNRRARAALKNFEAAWKRADRQDALLQPYFERAEQVRNASAPTSPEATSARDSSGRNETGTAVDARAAMGAH